MICISLSFAVILEPLLSATSKGFGLNGVEILFCFGCLTSTVYPIFVGDCLHWNLFSQFFILSFAILSFSVIWVTFVILCCGAGGSFV